MDIRLRPAEEDDAHLLFQWRNDPVSARNSLNNNPLEWNEHKAWLDQSLKNPTREILIGFWGGNYDYEPIHSCGTIRFDELPAGLGLEVSINIDPNLRGRGLGRDLLRAGIERHSNRRLFATIRGENVASLIIFLASGFFLEEYNPISGLAYLKREPK
jgi:RimJ/RimL family protein N-acetyltransferase